MVPESVLATYNLSSGEWRIWTSGSKFLTSIVTVWGMSGDVPLPADYNGDRVTDLALIRDGGYEILLSSTNYLKSIRVH
jgi:hypothetical protein